MKAKTLLAAIVLVLLAACGNKGPLVMPQKPVPVDEPVPAPPAAPAAAPAETTPEPPAATDPATPPVDGTDG